jgi:hypothetical protein
MASVATWAAIIVSLIAAIGTLGFGGIIGARITARKEFEQQLRERMLGAADDFIGASTAALSSLRALDPTVRRHPLSRRVRAFIGDVAVEPVLVRNDLAREEIERVQTSIDETGRQLTRVVLIFSPISEATAEAKRGVERLLEAWGALQWYYALRRALESEDVSQRRAAIRRVLQSLGEAGFAAATRAVPGLHKELGGVAAWLVSGVVTNADKPLADARDGAARALDEASEALTEFASRAGKQVLVEPGSWPALKMTYTVTPEEQIVASARPVGRVRAWLRALVS